MKSKTLNRWVGVLYSAVFFMVGAGEVRQEKRHIGLGELSRLIEMHQPKTPLEPSAVIDTFQKKVVFNEGGEPATFIIPGFNAYRCNTCHEGELLAQQTATRMQRIIKLLKRDVPFVKMVPLKQFILQPYADALLKKQQFAHTTFDTIRLFPRTLIVDSYVYDLATQIHETLHLTQPFLGHPNELEAYTLNILADPRFLLFNYRYFENTIQGFYVKDFKTILDRFFARDTRDDIKVPLEVQWYHMPFDSKALGQVRVAIQALRFVLDEAFRINRKYPLQTAYWSDRTGIPSFVLDLAAVKLLPLPTLTLSPEIQTQAWNLFAKQFSKTDNTRLGYIIDRKKETLMTLRFQHSLKDSEQGLILYFNYLKRRFLKEDGKLDLEPDDRQDFLYYIDSRVEDVLTMLSYPGITPIEREGGLKLAEWAKKQLATLIGTESLIKP